MNSFARVARAVGHEPGGPVARGELVLDRGFARNFLNWRGGGVDPAALADTDLLLACGRLLALDLVCVPSGRRAAGGGILSPPAADIGRLSGEGLFVFWVVEGAFQSAMTRRGMMPLLGDLARAPDEVVRELRDKAHQAADAMARGVAAGARGIIIADDIAYGKGTLMAPEFVEKQLLPVWQAQVTAAHDLGVPVFLHSDGNLNAVLPHILAAGFDGLQCIEPAAGMDMGDVRDRCGKALCLMGNIDPALLSGPGDPGGDPAGCAGLRRAVKDAMASAGGRGGFIFGTCCGLHAGMRPERVDAMYRLAAELDPPARAMIP